MLLAFALHNRIYTQHRQQHAAFVGIGRVGRDDALSLAGRLVLEWDDVFVGDVVVGRSLGRHGVLRTLCWAYTVFVGPDSM